MTEPIEDHAAPVLIDHELLTEAPDRFLEHVLQDRFEAQHRSMVAEARQRVITAFGSDPSRSGEQPDAFDPKVRPFTGFDVRGIDPLALVRRSLEAASGPLSRAELVASEAHIDLATTRTDRLTLDPLKPGTILRALDAGWQLCVHAPRGLDDGLQAVVEDMAVAYGAETSLYYGIRSALGSPPSSTEQNHVLIQLAGRRTVVIHADGDQQQVRMHPGHVLVTPGEWQVTHLPLDEDTLHLDISLPSVSDPDGPSQNERAMRPAHTSASYNLARTAIGSDPAEGWPMRLAAPGGVHLVSADDEAVVVVVGGVRLTLSVLGAQVLLALSSGQYQPGSDIAASLSCEPREVVSFCEELWALGLLDPAPLPPAQPQGGARLTQVASTPEGRAEVADTLLALVDEHAWRSPLDGEVHYGADLDVAVQPLSLTENQGSWSVPLAIALQMNAQFFELDARGPINDDPPLLVRVRPVTADATGTSSLGSDLHSHPTRKLTFVVALSALSEGWIQIPGGSTATDAAPGSVSAWPALRPWQLAPIPQGEYVFLLARIHGPAFR